MKDNVYVVTSEWNTYEGDQEFKIIGVSLDLKGAIKMMNAEVKSILSASYGSNSVEEAKKNEDYTIEEEHGVSFCIRDETLYDHWNKVEIHERSIEQRDFITIQFEYAGEVFSERIYIDDIDLNHYDTCWDWWFGSHNKSFPDLNFELTADKDENGNVSCDGMYINVYEDDGSIVPIETIEKVKWLRSWFESKQNYIGK